MQVFNDTLDLRGQPCPGNLPQLLIKLETMSSGEVLQLIVDDLIALDKIPMALSEEDDFEILACETHQKPNIVMFIKIK